MKTIAIITARGNSKRIPKKNIKLFCGKPILCYAIDVALKSGIFDEVMVSTDSPEIADIAIDAGAKIPFLRSKENASDVATTVDVLSEVIENFRNLGQEYDTVCCLYPTAIFITKEILRDAYSILSENPNFNCVTPIVKYDFPPQRCFQKVNNEIMYLYPEYEKTRSQDLQPLYHDCGQFYFIRTRALIDYRSMIPPHTVPIILKETDAQDIDTPEDWLIAEIKYKAIRGCTNETF